MFNTKKRAYETLLRFHTLIKINKIILKKYRLISPINSTYLYPFSQCGTALWSKTIERYCLCIYIFLLDVIDFPKPHVFKANYDVHCFVNLLYTKIKI